mmetsp:Transcript_15886/g.43886  ORF Transcript_15886/g.43886 Transcript_15886/m.43886 type:complete len:253 (-) Transcript_15886:147-905(-)
MLLACLERRLAQVRARCTSEGVPHTALAARAGRCLLRCLVLGSRRTLALRSATRAVIARLASGTIIGLAAGAHGGRRGQEVVLIRQEAVLIDQSVVIAQGIIEADCHRGSSRLLRLEGCGRSVRDALLRRLQHAHRVLLPPLRLGCQTSKEEGRVHGLQRRFGSVADDSNGNGAGRFQQRGPAGQFHGTVEAGRADIGRCHSNLQLIERGHAHVGPAACNLFGGGGRHRLHLSRWSSGRGSIAQNQTKRRGC